MAANIDEDLLDAAREPRRYMPPAAYGNGGHPPAAGFRQPFVLLDPQTRFWIKMSGLVALLQLLALVLTILLVLAGAFTRH